MVDCIGMTTKNNLSIFFAISCFRAFSGFEVYVTALQQRFELPGRLSENQLNGR